MRFKISHLFIMLLFLAAPLFAQNNQPSGWADFGKGVDAMAAKKWPLSVYYLDNAINHDGKVSFYHQTRGVLWLVQAKPKEAAKEFNLSEKYGVDPLNPFFLRLAGQMSGLNPPPAGTPQTPFGKLIDDTGMAFSQINSGQPAKPSAVTKAHKLLGKMTHQYAVAVQKYFRGAGKPQ
jgi:hypothetical protein